MLSQEHRATLHQVARHSIEIGVSQHRAPTIDAATYAPELQQKAASFITLHHHDMLRGCIGSLEPRKTMVEDVNQNAYSAAFLDRRFDPISKNELDGLNIHISILGPTEPMTFDSKKDLLQQLQPGVDGLVLSCPYHRATFLPAVWESLPEPSVFLSHLLTKAGLPADYWSDDISVDRYHVEEF